MVLQDMDGALCPPHPSKPSQKGEIYIGLLFLLSTEFQRGNPVYITQGTRSVVAACAGPTQSATSCKFDVTFL